MQNLPNKKCMPCSNVAQTLPSKNILKSLKELGYNWKLNKARHLYKEYKFDNFINPMKFANSIAKLAEQEGHHPDLIISWGKCGVEIWTHKVNGLTENDFILAAKIERLYRPRCRADA